MMDDTYQAFLHRIRSFPKDKPEIILASLQVFHNKWSAYIIFQLLKNRTMRFGELKKAIPGTTNTTLTTALRELETQDIVCRKQYNEIPPHVEYSLTDTEMDLLPVFYELVQWGKAHVKS